MRLTPAQIGVRLICGEHLPPFGEGHISANASLAERLAVGHAWLVKISGKDFGYDLAAWHAHLKESREGGYTWGRNVVLPRVMKSAIESKDWQNAVRANRSEFFKTRR